MVEAVSHRYVQCWDAGESPSLALPSGRAHHFLKKGKEQIKKEKQHKSYVLKIRGLNSILSKCYTHGIGTYKPLNICNIHRKRKKNIQEEQLQQQEKCAADKIYV